MRILVACEFSGAVRDALILRGHEAYSIDLEPGEGQFKTYRHITGYVQRLFDDPRMIAEGMNKWDMMIAFPPCTHLAVSGARWFKNKQEEQRQAIAFVEYLWSLPIPRIAIENPIGVLSTRSKLRKPTQIIEPWQFWHLDKPGAGEKKATCLWLKNLPKLIPTTPEEVGRYQACWKMPPKPNRGKERSRTYRGVANAMAEQWAEISKG